jgi:hypothetical protein
MKVCAPTCRLGIGTQRVLGVPSNGTRAAPPSGMTERQGRDWIMNAIGGLGDGEAVVSLLGLIGRRVR